MNESKRSMFNDRRNSNDRRKQDLSMPAGLDRRIDSRRTRQQFQAQPWWLRTGYVEEYVSEQIASTIAIKPKAKTRPVRLEEQKTD